MAVDHWGQKKGMPEGQAWDPFCKAAVARFLEWSENVDTSGQTIPIPPLDVLMVWHSFMLNPRDYMFYSNRVLKGRFEGKGIDWQQLKPELNSDSEDLAPYLTSLINTNRKPNLQDSSRSSKFDLVAAIQRQLKFSAKMYDADYLKSPFFENILSDAIDRYEKFFTLIVENPGVGIAPTMDIDLVWHTHQLSPESYAAYCRQRTGGRLVNHNDNLDDETLRASGINGETLFFEKFGTSYRICLCERCMSRRFAAKTSSPSGCLKVVTEEPRDNADSDCNVNCQSYHDKALAVFPKGSCSSTCSNSCSNNCGNNCMQCKNECASDCQDKCNTNCHGKCGRECGYVCGACTSKKLEESAPSGVEPKDSCSSCSSGSSCNSQCQSFCHGGGTYQCMGPCGEECGYVCGACDAR